MLQAVAVLAQALDLVLAAIELRVARMVAVEAAGIDLDRAGSAAAAGALDRLARGLVHREEIVAVDLDRRQAEPAGAAGDVAAADSVGERRCPRRTGCSRTRRSPAASAPPPCSSPRRWCPGWSRRRRRTHTATVPVPSVLAVSAAPTTSGGPPPTMPLAPSMPRSRSAMCIEPPLPPHSPPFLANSSCIMPVDVAALGDAVAVAAMGAGDVVLGAEMRADADRGGLLAGIEMDKAGDAALGELLLHPLLEAADRRHRRDRRGSVRRGSAASRGSVPSRPPLKCANRFYRSLSGGMPCSARTSLMICSTRSR